MQGINENMLTYTAYQLIRGRPAKVAAGMALAGLAQEMFPSSAAAHQRLAEGSDILGDIKKAAFHYQRALSLDPENKEIMAALEKLGALTPQ